MIRTALAGNIYQKPRCFRIVLPYHFKKYINLKGLPVPIFAFENRSYLGEFEAEFKKALARESGAQGVLFDEKIEGRKSRDTVPLSTSILLYFYLPSASLLKIILLQIPTYL
jgi:hypothetical protein